MEKFLRKIDTNLFMKQKEWLAKIVAFKNEDSEYAEGILNFLDTVQDFCEQKYNMDFNSNKSTYTVKALNKDKEEVEVTLTSSQAESIYRMLKKNYHEEDVRNYLEDNNITVTDDEFKEIVNSYEDSISDSEDFYIHLRNAVNQVNTKPKINLSFFKFCYEEYIKDWCRQRGNNPINECFVCEDKFYKNKFQDSKYMNSILQENEFELWKIIHKENILPSEYKIPVEWEVYSISKIKAVSLEEAVQIFKETIDDIPLPTEPEYIDGSFKISSEDLEYLKLFNEGERIYTYKDK